MGAFGEQRARPRGAGRPAVATADGRFNRRLGRRTSAGDGAAPTPR